jgi:hypothetical protein
VRRRQRTARRIGTCSSTVEDGGGQRGLDAGGGDGDVADGYRVVCGGLDAVPGAADEGGRTPVQRRVEELEHRLKHVVEDPVCGW